jgi:hypothetical protein
MYSVRIKLYEEVTLLCNLQVRKSAWGLTPPRINLPLISVLMRKSKISVLYLDISLYNSKDLGKVSSSRNLSRRKLLKVKDNLAHNLN